MARLNEPPVAPPPPSAEQLDALKRKFMRTNRELAKINSQQQIHIRTLENERSRLVAENCSLAQRVIHLQNTLEAHQHAPSLSSIESVKSQLAAKIQELGGLVAELGSSNRRNHADAREGERIKVATRKTPEERQWRSALGLQEVENAMLPTITESKAYPRMTMNAEELHDIFDAPESQSPDIGPPPVSRFDIEEPIAFNHGILADDRPEAPVDEDAAILPINLETRRRRRESGPKIEKRRMSLFESLEDEEPKEEPAKATRTGAKRKFSVQEDEDKGQRQTEQFQFSRRGAPVSGDDGNPESGAHPLSPTRPILSSKPVNTDPVLSPKKQRSAGPEKPEKIEKPSRKPTARPRTTASRTAPLTNPPTDLPEPTPIAEVHLDTRPPKTPAAETVLSPSSTHPSTSRAESKDTPPPGDLTLGGQTGAIARPSRRARPQVSYKEPSLNTKMRRPSKELVDAVIDLSRRTSVDPPQTAPNSAHVEIKEELGEESWKPMGASSALQVGGGTEAGSPLRQKLDRKEESEKDKKPERQKLNSEAAERAIEKMIEETSTGKRKSLSSLTSHSETHEAEHPRMSDGNPQADEGQKGDMAIFEFTSSSPPQQSAARPKVSLASAVREKRRHSSVASAAGIEGRTSRHDGGSLSTHKRTMSGSAKTAPMAGLARTTATARASMREREREREKRTNGLGSSGTSSGVGAKEHSEGMTESRDGRAASRRKSMMI